ncbi:hypothetical protein M3Y99_00402300 [Aphelenchoides fujianensis]|nr:hypothetical protein M3Y99_00402300 [Aphelenchoides fujianensis]
MASENGTNRDSCCSSASSSSSNASASASPPPSKNGESTFKTPSAPSRRPNGPLKKRADGAPDSETPANPEQDPGDANAKTSEDPETRPEVPATTSDAIDAAAEKSAESQKEAEQAAVLPTSVCPNTQKCFTERYPNLPAKSLSDPKVDLLDEMVVDDYSLILFNSYTDYKIFKVHEDEVLERERQEERQRQVEEAARIAKLKKKGRKSKAQLEKAQRIARRTERRERRERERVERREVRRRERQEKKSRGEPLIKPDKQERQARRERREQRIRERQERQREKRERHEREREARRQQQKLQKPTLAHPAAVGSQPLGAAHASAIGISDLAQHRQRFEQLYHMRKPATPATSNMEELVAAAAVLAAANHAENPNQNGRLPTVRVTLDPHPPTSSALHKAATNENAISDSSRSDSSVLKRPGAVTAGVKRPLSELDQQQQNGPQGKLMKYEDLHNEYKKMLFNQSPQQSRRNSLQPQQQMGLGQLNYPFLGGLPPTADPSFRFAVPQHQIPMGLQRAAAAQQLGQLPPGVSAAAMADMLQHPFSPLTSMMNAVNANNAKTTAASSAAQSSMPGQTTSGVQPKAEVPNPLDFTPHHVFANNPDFASTLQQALSAMNAVDPGLLGVNAPLLGMGLPGQIPGLPMMGPNGLVNPLTEAHRQLEAIQLQQHKGPRPATRRSAEAVRLEHAEAHGAAGTKHLGRQSPIQDAPIDERNAKPQDLEGFRPPAAVAKPLLDGRGNVLPTAARC